MCNDKKEDVNFFLFDCYNYPREGCRMKPPIVMEHIKPAHIECTESDLASTVIMPGDPLRAKYIAAHYLEDATLVSRARNMFAYTGTYKGKRVSVMGSGMGMPSMSIYAFELFYFFHVKRIIRVGTCGGLTQELNVPDLILATESYNEGNFAYSYNGDLTHYAYPSKELNQKIQMVAQEKGKKLFLGTVMSTEQFGFYSDNEHVLSRVPSETNIIGEEMESFALFHIASSFGLESACLLTVVDSKFKETFMTIEEREKSLDDMITIALDAAILD